MAQPINCDICADEPAVQMLTNLATGDVMSLGAACLPLFYGQSALLAIEAGDHAGPAGKCQACRRFHERMTTPVTPMTADTPAPAPPETSAGDQQLAAETP